ncbi:MAG: hypothetical protein CMP23_12320 [Rickettsiales bacterium]|nr:hypothetical protein [Rickettsiales bacterium]|tara:strand:- start:96 stop:2033 length:1938 start_codon:yes stop_codon:yes gene_type:complete
MHALHLLFALLMTQLLFAPPVHAQQAQVEDFELDSLIEAEDISQRILITPFAATTRDSVALAGSLHQFLIEELRASKRHDLLELLDCQAIEQVDAALYYAGCPPGDELGCQLIIGEKNDIERVVSGRVTALEDGDFRVAVTVLDVARAELALTYVLDLRRGEEQLLPRTVMLTLDNLMQQELDAPYEDARKRQEARMKAMELARSEDERKLLARMSIDLRSGELERLEAELAETQQRYLSQAELEEMQQTEGADAAWQELGISSKQYRSLTNSGLDFETWRWRWAGHRMQLIGSVQVGIIGGATGLRYAGGYYLSPDLEREVDNFAWQQVDEGSSMNLGISIGFGILRNLDLELSAFWSRSKVYIRLLSGSTIADPEDSNQLVPDPNNRPAGDWSEQSVNLLGGEVMLRYYFLTLPKLRPSLGLGFGWLTYPSLYNDPDVPDAEESPPPPIQGQFGTFRPVVDFGPQIEPGVQFEINRFMGLFVRVPILFAASPKRSQSTRFIETNPIFSDEEAQPGGKAPFGVVRAVFGIQGRLFGMPVQPRQDYDDSMELEEEPKRPARPRETAKDGGSAPENIEAGRRQPSNEPEILMEVAEQEPSTKDSQSSEILIEEADDEETSDSLDQDAEILIEEAEEDDQNGGSDVR